MAGVDTVMGLVAQGRRLERERIIALLTERFPTGWDYAEKDPIASVIALIKGEQK